jgi:hypothetical protein
LLRATSIAHTPRPVAVVCVWLRSHRYRYILGGSRKTNLSRRHTGFSAGSRVSHTVSLYIGLQGRCGSGQVRDGTERWEAGCVLVQLELTGVAPEDIVARLPADLLLHVELRRVSCCLLQHREGRQLGIDLSTSNRPQHWCLALGRAGSLWAGSFRTGRLRTGSLWAPGSPRDLEGCHLGTDLSTDLSRS